VGRGRKHNRTIEGVREEKGEKMMYTILFCTTAIVIMVFLVYKLARVVKKFDDIIGEKDA
jgi:cell division protein FtsL